MLCLQPCIPWPQASSAQLRTGLFATPRPPLLFILNIWQPQLPYTRSQLYRTRQKKKSMPNGKRAPRLYQEQFQLSTNVTSSGRPSAWPRGWRSHLCTPYSSGNALPLGSPFPSRPRLIGAETSSACTSSHQLFIKKNLKRYFALPRSYFTHYTNLTHLFLATLQGWQF